MGDNMNEDMVKLAEEYAEIAENLLEENGQAYTEDDVVKVANALIDLDYPEENEDTDEEDYEKLAEDAFLDGFNDELEKVAATYSRAGGLPGEGVTRGLSQAEMVGAAVMEKIRPVTRYKSRGRGLGAAAYRNPGRVGKAAMILGALGLLGAGAGAGYGFSN